MKCNMLKIEIVQDQIVKITLNRPEKRNAMNAEMIQELIQVLQDSLANPTIRILIMEGAGEHFCAGADIAWMQDISNKSREDNIADAQQLALLFKTLYHFPKPTIALIQGMTLGGGLGLTACCDIVLAANNAHFCFSEVKIGLTPSVISPYIISAIGERATRYYFLTAENFDAIDAKKMGLIHQVVNEEDLMCKGIALAESLLMNSTFALREVKHVISHVARQKISNELIEWTAEHLTTMRCNEDAQEGLSAFLNKRKAVWK